MKLSDLIKNCLHLFSFKAGMINDPDISSISSDSRNVKQGGLFIAVKGFMVDGHDYIDQAFENGAAAVIAEHNPKKVKNLIISKNSRLSMAAIAANFYGNPSKDMILTGITGTNGKTSISWLLESIFKVCGFSTGVIGTINIRYNNQVFDNPVTTPDSIDLQKTLYKMKKAKVTHVIMEVSSHGLDLNRIDYCCFDAGVFTNLTRDHLDFHQTMDKYLKSKKRFFTDFLGPKGKNNAPAILNIDDPKGKDILKSISLYEKTLEFQSDLHALSVPARTANGCYPAITVSTKKKADIFFQKTLLTTFMVYPELFICTMIHSALNHHLSANSIWKISYVQQELPMP